jgi:hypothetical protein
VHDSNAGLLEGPGIIPEGPNELFYAEMADQPGIARGLRSNDEGQIYKITHLSPKHQHKHEKLKLREIYFFFTHDRFQKFVASETSMKAQSHCKSCSGESDKNPSFLVEN